MKEMIPDLLLNILTIAVVYSIIQTSIVEWLKQSKLFNNAFLLWISNAIISLALGSYFSVYFFEVSWESGIWVGLFSVIGAAGIYKSLIKTKKELSDIKEQNFNQIIEQPTVQTPPAEQSITNAQQTEVVEELSEIGKQFATTAPTEMKFDGPSEIVDEAASLKIEQGIIINK